MTIFFLSLWLRQIIDPLIHAGAKVILRRSHNPLARHYHTEEDFLLFVFLEDEISDVKEMSKDFVRKTLEEKGASFTYILVPFSDPGMYQADVKCCLLAITMLTDGMNNPVRFLLLFSKLVIPTTRDDASKQKVCGCQQRHN